MPITKSAKKALRGSERKKVINDRRTKIMKDTIKRVEKLAKDKKADAKKMLPVSYAEIDKAMKRSFIKKNNASCKKARLLKITK